MSWVHDSAEKKEITPAPKPQVKEQKFDFSEEENSSKEVITIYGNKGDGKTTLGFSEYFDGTVAAISFDHKTGLIKKYMYGDDKRLKVFDGLRYFDEDPAQVLNTSEVTIQYIYKLLENIGEADWIMIDGLEILQKIAEYAMRKRNGIQPFQGIANLNVWKIRKLILQGIHNKAIKVATKGVIYTTYTSKDKIVEDGTIVKMKDVPNYMDTILYETDCVIRAESKIDEKEKKFVFTVMSSKIPRFMTGDVIDFTVKK